MSEHQQQSALFQWANTSGIPELKLIFAIPNGGHRHAAVGAKMKREGVKAGVPDIMLPAARNGYHGLFIELKDIGKGKKATTKQKEWIDDLQSQGYRAAVCEGWEDAKGLILDYLNVAHTTK